MARSVWSVAATSADSEGWLVVPAMLATAASTASTPASMAAIRVASCPPAVSWVCRCTGRSNRLRSAVTRARAAGGRSSPAMSLMASTCAPALDDLVGQLQVVVQCVQLLAGVRQVGGVAERDLGQAVPVARTASMAGRICATSLSASKMRKMSIPVPRPPRRRRRSPRSGTGCSRPCCARAAASGCRCSARPDAARPAGPTGPRPGSAAPRRRSRRPSTPGTAAAARCAPRTGRRPAGPGCAPGWPAATGGRRGTWCR